MAQNAHGGGPILLDQDQLVSLRKIYDWTSRSSSPSEYPVPRKEEGLFRRRLSDRQIRLCTLLAGDSFPIRCRLEVVDLQKCGPFCALSYAWGDKLKDLPEITVEGVAFPISRNLHDALEEIREYHTDVVIWVDFLCINQADDDERSSQVSMMREIYSRASEVFVWLSRRSRESGGGQRRWTGVGSDKENAVNRTMDAQRSTSGIVSSTLTALRSFRLDALSFLNMLAQNEHILHIPALHSPFHRFQVLHELRKMMQLAWWDRIWVVQETVVSRKVWVLCGSDVISWEVLGRAARNLEHHRQVCCAAAFNELSTEEVDMVTHFSHSVLKIEMARRHWDTRQPIKLTHLLWQFRSRKAGDVRDKVLALLGLVEPHSWLPKINYNDFNSVFRVYQDVVKFCLTHEKNLNVLMGSAEGSGMDLPSWVPDWSVPLQPSSLKRIARAEDLYDASGGTNPLGWYMEENDLTGQTLGMRGIHVSTVLGVADAVRNPDNTHLQAVFARWRIFVAEFFDVSSPSLLRHVDYAGGGTVMDALLRTQCGDTTCRGSPLHVLLPNSAAGQPNHPPSSITTIRGTPKLSNYLTLEVYDWVPSACPESLLALGADPEMDNSIRSATNHRRLFVTTDGYIGLGPLEMQSGDEVFVLSGGRTPFLLRKHEIKSELGASQMEVSGDCYTLAGDCYVHGIMRGEVIDAKGKDSMRPLRLV